MLDEEKEGRGGSRDEEAGGTRRQEGRGGRTGRKEGRGGRRGEESEKMKNLLTIMKMKKSRKDASMTARFLGRS